MDLFAHLRARGLFLAIRPAIFMTFAALLDPGDQVIVSDPHYACYPNFINFVDGETVTVPVYEKDGFQYRPEAIEALGRHVGLQLDRARCYPYHGR